MQVLEPKVIGWLLQVADSLNNAEINEHEQPLRQGIERVRATAFTSRRFFT